jgi:ribosomal protein L29
MELKVEEIKSLAPVQFNYEDIKKWVTEKASEYKSVVYTPETITLAKQDRATLNKVSDAINNEKKRIKNELLKPYVDFENKCKELMAIVDDASKTIDKQVKEFEEKEQNEKREQIKAIFETYIGQLKDLINFDIIFNPRWLNKTYTIKKIEEEINHLIVKTHDDLSVIDAQIKDENINKSVKSYYFSNINNASVLGDALQEGMRIEENNKKLEELKKQQDAKKQENASNTKQDAPVQVTPNLRQIDFRVWVTNEQMIKLRDFLKANNIEYGRVE